MHSIIKHIIPDALINHKFPPPPYGYLTWGILTYMGVLYYSMTTTTASRLVSGNVMTFNEYRGSNPCKWCSACVQLSAT